MRCQMQAKPCNMQALPHKERAGRKAPTVNEDEAIGTWQQAAVSQKKLGIQGVGATPPIQWSSAHAVPRISGSAMAHIPKLTKLQTPMGIGRQHSTVYLPTYLHTNTCTPLTPACSCIAGGQALAHTQSMKAHTLKRRNSLHCTDTDAHRLPKRGAGQKNVHHYWAHQGGWIPAKGWAAIHWLGTYLILATCRESTPRTLWQGPNAAAR